MRIHNSHQKHKLFRFPFRPAAAASESVGGVADRVEMWKVIIVPEAGARAGLKAGRKDARPAFLRQELFVHKYLRSSVIGVMPSECQYISAVRCCEIGLQGPASRGERRREGRQNFHVTYT